MADARPSEPHADRHLRALPSPEVDTSDWPAQAADTIERAVQGVRDKTTGPAITAARWFVAGVYMLIAGTVVAVLLAIAFVRILDAYIPDGWVGEEHVWLAHGFVGAVCSAVGLWLLSRRSKTDVDAS